MSDVSLHQLDDWLGRAAAAIIEARDHLTELDSAIGDADHGANLSRGFKAVVEKATASPATSISGLLQSSGMTLVSTVGGASGPLYGTLLLRIAKGVGDEDSVSAERLGQALRLGLEGVVARGKAELGDKTMVDALEPAVRAYEEAVSAGSSAGEAAAAAAKAAAEGRDNTEDLVARKGRASYLGERSVGHIDPGAASTTILLEALAEALVA